MRTFRQLLRINPLKNYHVNSSPPFVSNLIQRNFSADTLPEHVRIKMPQILEEVESGKILRWHKHVGDKLSPKDAICDIQVGDLTVSLKPETEGYLAEVSIPSGSLVRIGTTLARQVETETEVSEFRKSWNIRSEIAKKNLVIAHRILSSQFDITNIMCDHLSMSVPSYRSFSLTNETEGTKKEGSGVEGNARTLMTARVGCDWKTLKLDDLLDIHVDLTKKTAINLNNNESLSISSDYVYYQHQSNLKKQMDVKVSALHTSLLASDPNIRAIFHLHSPLLMAFSCLSPPFHQLRPDIHPLACAFLDKIIYYRGSSDLQGATDENIAVQVAQRGSSNTFAIVVKNEGVIIVAPTVTQAFHRFYNFKQMVALQMNLYKVSGFSGEKRKFEVMNENEVQRLAKEYIVNEPQVAEAHFFGRAASLRKTDPDLFEYN